MSLVRPARARRMAAAASLVGLVLAVVVTAPGPVGASSSCAAGWTDVGGGVCELVVTSDGSVSLPGAGDFDLLVVGGGGGGGGAGGDSGIAANPKGRAGGGGGGQVTVCADEDLAGSLTIAIGLGGAGGPGDPAGIDGSPGGTTSVLVGSAGLCNAVGGQGGRSGGSDKAAGTDPWADGGTSGNGRSGGQSQWTACTAPCDAYTSGGGGGAGAAAVGANASGGAGGAGGAGAGGSGLFTGDSRVFGGGGGGGSGRADLPVPAGGNGGGGAGGRALSTSTFDAAVGGTPNTGGGGGGGAAGSNFRADGADGGAGIVIIRYDLTEVSSSSGPSSSSVTDDPCTGSASWVPFECAPPSQPAGSGQLVVEDGSERPMTVSAPTAGRLRYEADGVRVTLSAGVGTSVTSGPIVPTSRAITCEVCVSLPVGGVLEIWMFSEPRLVAAWRVTEDACQTFSVPVGEPLDGLGPISAGPHTLQVAMPTAAGMRAVNVGVTVVDGGEPGGPIPTSVPAGEGPARSIPPMLVLLTAAVALAGVGGRRASSS